jgi:A/G-specific adenine glycosylase
VNTLELFQQKIFNFYQENKRNFSWRENITPYKIFISEVMLQQTQTVRVIEKFEQWLQKFPNFETLAHASAHQVLSCWQGLGYNRRGLYLHEAAKIIVYQFAGMLPDDPKILQTLPGIGPNTAGSIVAFAFDKPTVFIETNIRTVFLYEFFQGKDQVSDQEILKLVQQSLPKNEARAWYYALMDYGVFLKKQHKANNKTSKSYTRQSKFIGSRRQVRGAIIRVLTKQHVLTEEQLYELLAYELPHNMHDVARILQELVDEKMIRYEKYQYFL